LVVYLYWCLFYPRELLMSSPGPRAYAKLAAQH
jgi:hypothetical protein